jgi:hypothetical protein
MTEVPSGRATAARAGRTLPCAASWEVRTAEVEAARAWLARRRPELLERVGGS